MKHRLGWLWAGLLIAAVTFISVMVVNTIRPDKSKIDIVEFVKSNNLKISEEMCEETIGHRWGEIENVSIVVLSCDESITKPDYVRKCQICGKVQFGWKQKPVLWYTVDEFAVKWRTVDELQTKIEIFDSGCDADTITGEWEYKADIHNFIDSLPEVKQ